MQNSKLLRIIGEWRHLVIYISFRFVSQKACAKLNSKYAKTGKAAMSAYFLVQQTFKENLTRRHHASSSPNVITVRHGVNKPIIMANGLFTLIPMLAVGISKSRFREMLMTCRSGIKVLSKNRQEPNFLYERKILMTIIMSLHLNDWLNSLSFFTKVVSLQKNKMLKRLEKALIL
jgi:hypothetical protein